MEPYCLREGRTAFFYVGEGGDFESVNRLVEDAEAPSYCFEPWQDLDDPQAQE